jgi:hypothetical protein
MAFAGRAPSRHAQTPNARLVLRNTNAHGRRPNIWPQALQAPIQHQRPTDHQIHVHYHKYPTNPPSTNTMPPKQRTPVSGAAPTTTSTPARSTKSTGTDAQDILQGIYNKYVQKTPQLGRCGRAAILLRSPCWKLCTYPSTLYAPSPRRNVARHGDLRNGSFTIYEYLLTLGDRNLHAKHMSKLASVSLWPSHQHGNNDQL